MIIKDKNCFSSLAWLIHQSPYSFFHPTIKPIRNRLPTNLKNICQRVYVVLLITQKQAMATITELGIFTVFTTFFQGRCLIRR